MYGNAHTTVVTSKTQETHIHIHTHIHTYTHTHTHTHTHTPLLDKLSTVSSGKKIYLWNGHNIGYMKTHTHKRTHTHTHTAPLQTPHVANVHLRSNSTQTLFSPLHCELHTYTSTWVQT